MVYYLSRTLFYLKTLMHFHNELVELTTIITDVVIKIEDKGKHGMRVDTYILASQDLKDRTGRRFDEYSTCSRLPGSLRHDRVMNANFDRGGHLNVHPYWDPHDQDPNVGGRSEGIKK